MGVTYNELELFFENKLEDKEAISKINDMHNNSHHKRIKLNTTTN